MRHLQLGAGPRVSALGLGCMGMSGMYGPADRAESIATIHAALDAGVTLLDTGDFYGMGYNEMLIAEAMKGRNRDHAIISVKFGAMRDPTGGWSGPDCRPEAVRNFLAYSLQRLGVDHIDIYRPARLDPNVPIEDTIGAIADMVKAGYVRYIGLSEVGVETIRRAAAVHPICDLQIEYSLISRGIEAAILPACRELGIGLTPYGVLSRGLISGHWRRDAAGAGDFRAYSPRFQAENVDRNLALVEALRELAQARNVSVAQIAIAWVAAQGDDIVPLIGSRRRDQLAEALGALDVALMKEDLWPRLSAPFQKAPPPANAQMAHLDSEHEPQDRNRSRFSARHLHQHQAEAGDERNAVHPRINGLTLWREASGCRFRVPSRQDPSITGRSSPRRLGFWSLRHCDVRSEDVTPALARAGVATRLWKAIPITIAKIIGPNSENPGASRRTKDAAAIVAVIRT